MKIASSFLYICLTLLYCLYTGEEMAIMYGVGQLTLLLFISILCYFQWSEKPSTQIERLFYQYCMFVTIGRSLYTLYCLFMSAPWIIYNTDVFAFIVGCTFLIFLIYVAYKYSTLK